jgi:glycosyltransferase involved in cell wall biosynthesis
MAIRATVVIPTHNHGPTLVHAARSALAQTVHDLELFIIGDGVPPVTRQIVNDLQAADRRVRFFDFPKGPRLGEAYRHEVLAQAAAPIVCYLSDDDLWLPNHIETMEATLRAADFAHALSVRVEPDGTLLAGNTIDFRVEDIRRRALSDDLALGGAPLSCMAHTLAIYRQLPRGWHTTPKGIATNVYMTRQFIALAECRLANAAIPTLLRFPSFSRRRWTLEQRVQELEVWSSRVADQEWRLRLPFETLDSLARVSAERYAEVRRLEVKIERLQQRARRAEQAGAAAEARAAGLHQKLTAARERVRTVNARGGNTSRYTRLDRYVRRLLGLSGNATSRTSEESDPQDR